jgi:predicted enzyme related to lactoylglutathione lyase
MIFEERTLLATDVRRHHAFYSAILSDIPFYDVFEVIESPLSYRIQNSLTRNAIVVQPGEPIESDRPLVSYSLNLIKDMSTVSSRIESVGGAIHREAREIKPGIWALWGVDSLGQHFGLVCSSHE